MFSRSQKSIQASRLYRWERSDAGVMNDGGRYARGKQSKEMYTTIKLMVKGRNWNGDEAGRRVGRKSF